MSLQRGSLPIHGHMYMHMCHWNGSNCSASVIPRRIRHVIKAKGHVTKYCMFGEYNVIYHEVIASQTNFDRITYCDIANVKYFCHITVYMIGGTYSTSIYHWFVIFILHVDYINGSNFYRCITSSLLRLFFFIL